MGTPPETWDFCLGICNVESSAESEYSALSTLKHEYLVKLWNRNKLCYLDWWRPKQCKMWSVILWIFSLFSYTSHLWTAIISRYPVLISGSVQYPHHHTQSTRCAGSLSLFGNCFTLLHIKLLQGKSFYQLQSCSLLVVSLISIWRLRLLMHVDIDSSRIRHLLAYLFYTVRKMYVYTYWLFYHSPKYHR